MLNCPATNNTCPARKWKHVAGFLEALSTTQYKAMDGIPVDDEVYRSALLAVREILVDGCSQCVRNAVIWLAKDLRWPPNRTFQLVLLDAMLERSQRYEVH